MLLFVPIVSHTEVLLLYERFQMLGPDEDGFVHRSIFQKPPYSTNPFSRQVNVLSWFIFLFFIFYFLFFYFYFFYLSFYFLPSGPPVSLDSICGTQIGETLVYDI